MHKKIVNELRLRVALEAKGPLLIKAGETGGLDPTHPDMEFVRTGDRVYLPGSSLKGVVRSHAERIARTLMEGGAEGRGSCNPLERDSACGIRLERRYGLTSEEIYRQSCFICRLFGNTALASRIDFADAMPDEGSIRLEERNGVAIDRVFGSVAVGPFNYEVVTEGRFPTELILKNFTLGQLVLVGLVLRDIGAGRVALGFGKSRGLGCMSLHWQSVALRYPLAALRAAPPSFDQLLGVGALTPEAGYGFPSNDAVPLPPGLRMAEDGWGSYELAVEGPEAVESLFRAAMPRWQREVQGG